MPIENVLETSTITFIRDLGFPIASFVIMVSILMYVMKKDEKKQEKTEARYENLVNKFIETTQNLSNQNEKALKDIISELGNMTSELKIMSTKIDTYTKIIDKELQAKSKSYIFRGDKEERSQNKEVKW